MTLLGVSARMTAAEKLNNSIDEKPRSKPNKCVSPTKEQSENLARTAFWCLPQHCGDEYQSPAEKHSEEPSEPPRHTFRPGGPKTEDNERQGCESGKTNKGEDIIHGYTDIWFASGVQKRLPVIQPRAAELGFSREQPLFRWLFPGTYSGTTANGAVVPCPVGGRVACMFEGSNRNRLTGKLTVERMDACNLWHEP